MASFTETATLRVVDQSTGSINRINAALRQLQKTANSLKSKKIDLGLDTAKLTRAQASVRKLASEIARLKGAGGTINLRVNAQGMSNVQNQMRQLRASARNPITIRTLLGAELARSAMRHSYEAAKQGINDSDVGKTKLDLKQLFDINKGENRFTPGTRRAIAEANIAEILSKQGKQPGGGMWNRGQVSSQYAEMLGVVLEGASQAMKTQIIDTVKNAKGEDVQVPRVGKDNRPVMRDTTPQERMESSRRAQKAAQFLTENNMNLAQTLVDLGFSVEKANEDAVKFGKGIQVQNKVFNDATGEIDEAEARKQYSMINKLMASVGTEATGSNFLMLQKYLRGARFSLSEEATAITMSMYEEMGTTAAVGMNQMIRGFGGHAKKYALKEQARLGLIDTKREWKPGKGRKPGKWVESPGEMSEENAKKLRERPQDYIAENLEDAWRKDLLRANPKMTEEQIQGKFNDTSWVQRQIEKIMTERTAIDTAASLFNKRQENRRFIEDYRSRSGDPAVIRALTGNSIRGAVATMTNQFQGMFGEAALAIAPQATKIASTISGAMSGISEDIRTATEGGEAGEAARTRLIEKAAGGVMAGGAAFLGMRAIAGMAPMLGMAAGIQGSLDANPAVRALSNAGLALLGAAEALKGAADMQMKSSLLGMGEAALEALGLGADALKSKGITGGIKGLLKGGLKGGLALFLAELIGGPMGSDPPDDMATPQMRQARLMRDAARYEAQKARERQEAIERGETEPRPKPKKRESHLEARKADEEWVRSQYERAIAARKAADELYESAQRRYDEVVNPVKGEGAVQQQERERKEQEEKDKAAQQQQQSQAAEATKTASANIRESMGLFQQASYTTNDTVRSFTASTEGLGTTAGSLTDSAIVLGVASEALTMSLETMSTVSEGFSTAFDTGAAKLATAGQTASADMAAAAGGIGATIAAAFVAGASGLQIGVKMPDTITASAPANTGASKVT